MINITSGYFPVPHSLFNNKKLSNNDIRLYVIMGHLAAFAENVVNGVAVHRGELLTTHKELSAASGLTEKEERTAIKHLTDNGYILSIKNVKINDGVKGQRKLVTLLYDTVPDQNFDQKESDIESALTGTSDHIIKNQNNINFDLMKSPDTVFFDTFPICRTLTEQEKRALLSEIGVTDLKLVIDYLSNRKKPSKTSQSVFDTIRTYWHRGYVAGTTTHAAEPSAKTTTATPSTKVASYERYFGKAFYTDTTPQDQRLFVTQDEYVKTLEEWRQAVKNLENSGRVTISTYFSSVLNVTVTTDTAEKMLTDYAKLRGYDYTSEEMKAHLTTIYNRVNT